jgi:hypothetical protein
MAEPSRIATRDGIMLVPILMTALAATVAAELDVPEGVVVETVAVPNGWKHELSPRPGQ